MSKAKKPPPFYCPACGRKHRAAIDALKENPAARMLATCAQCGIQMSVGLKPDGALFAEAIAPTNAPTKATSITSKPTTNERTAMKRGSKASPGKTRTTRGSRDAKGRPSTQPGPKSNASKPSASNASASKQQRSPKATPTSDPNRYEIRDKIYDGSTTEVFRAFDTSTNREVAYKILKPDASETIQQRFLREIEAQANIRHPNIMPVFDRGMSADHRSYFTMELLREPVTLRQRVDALCYDKESDTRRHLDSRELRYFVKDILVPISKGIYVANVENGVIHRDLKPENVLIDGASGRPYVVDFGICDVVERKGGGSQIARAPSAKGAGIVGTPRYLPPEQVQGDSHARTDVWSLGALLFYLCAGEPPIAGASNISRAELSKRIEQMQRTLAKAEAAGDDSKAELCRSKLERMQDESLRTVDDIIRDAHRGNYITLPDETPEEVKAVIVKAMARDPARRYVNGRQFASDLEAWLGGSRVRAVSARGGKVAAKADARRAIRQHMGTGILALVGLLVGGAGAYALTRDVPRAPSSRVAAANSIVKATETRLPHLRQRLSAERLSPTEHRAWYERALRDVARAESWLANEPQTSGVVSTAQRVHYVRNQIDPGTFAFDVPRGFTVTISDRLKDTAVTPLERDKSKTENAGPPQAYRLLPGLYGATIVDANKKAFVTLPVQVPFRVRQGGVAPETVTVRIPGDITEGVPESARRIVTPSEHALPRTKLDAPFASLKGYWMATYEVTCRQYLSFLHSLKGAARAERVPAVNFTYDENNHAVTLANERTNESMPVRGVSADDARAFLTWRRTQVRRACRLPTVAEWIYAAGASLGFTTPNGEYDEAAWNPLNKLRRVGVAARDESPFGIRDMLGNARELCEHGEAIVLMGGAAGVPLGRIDMSASMVVAANEKHPQAGIRVVYPLEQ